MHKTIKGYLHKHVTKPFNAFQKIMIHKNLYTRDILRNCKHTQKQNKKNTHKIPWVTDFKHWNNT